MYLVRDGHISTGNPALDTNLSDLEIVTIGSSTFLYGTTGRNGGMVMFELSSNSGLARVRDINSFNSWQADNVGGFTAIIEIDGKMQAIFGGSGATQLLGYSVDGNGFLGGGTQNVDLIGATDRISAVLETQVNGTSVIFVADEGTGRLTPYTLQPDGTYDPLGSGVAVTGEVSLDLAQIGQTQFLLATDATTQSVVSYRIGSDGRLTAADSLGALDGLGIATPTALETIQVYGVTWVIVGAADSASISVMRLDGTGQLTATDHLIDTLDTRFDDLQDLVTVEAGGWAFVVAGGSDDGLSLFVLLPTGRMLHLQTMVHTTGAGLENIEAIEAVVVGGEIQIFVTSTVTGGVTQFSISLSDLGDVVQGQNTGSGQSLTGGDRDDMMVASATGDDTLLGGRGDDVLVTQAGDAQLWGGVGADIFVLGYHAQTLRIMDFTRGEDRLDLSAFPMLYDMAQLGFTATSTGARLTYGTSVIIITSDNGRPLTLEDIFGSGFDWANHIPIFTNTGAEENGGGPGSDPDDDDPADDTGGHDTTTGGTGNDTLIGSDGNDVLNGRAGNDRLIGNGGNDTLSGGTGSDTIVGGAGADVISGMDGDDILTGGSENDSIWGGAGDDRIAGGDGADLLVGSAGDDVLQGDGGNDTLRGDEGNDTIDAGWGADSLSGGFGDDSLNGGDGHDQVWGDQGNDTLLGGIGNDTLGGFIGDDWFYGGDGNDVIWGNSGTDRAWGGNGNDTLGGGDDSDTLYGEDGDDLVWGGHHGDLQYGGVGNDTVGGFSGDDTLYGGPGDDQIWGNVGDDIGYGDAGNDLFGGFAGNDTLYGGIGNDTLSGGEGDDALWGGGDADTFVFVGRIGLDTVHDFEPGIDTLQFGASNLSFSTLNMWQSGADTIIALPTGLVTLSGTQMNDLSASDFIFG